MPAFETLPRFEKDWEHLTPQQQGTFRKVVQEAFVRAPRDSSTTFARRAKSAR
ncbi:MAG: hypothetical protein ACRDNW_11840 [Trebonia sp.]